ncbi:MAG: selenocysteine-specific translation elongation factor [Actinomycetota bacterium]
MGAELRVVATAGHVDHGKSSLIVRLTGIDPDRWEEEKRRGLTIDLGYAWCTLPSGREVGFVDVPGHERFIGNMLAGVGPVRLVLFVVAADEGWRPQSEEHLQILDVLGVSGGVIALTKRDLVDDETLAIAVDEVRENVAGTVLEGAPIVAVSATTGVGLEELISALDAMLADATPPADARTRLFVDRIFSIKGAGTVVTGTLTGGCLRVNDEVELLPSGVRARIRGLQTHRQAEDAACPVTRVAANLVGVERRRFGRGEVLGHPGTWRPTTVFEGTVRPVRGRDSIPARGAYKVYVGAAEVDAKVRLASTGGELFARISTSDPLILDVGDRFVVREAGRRATVGGGVVLDVAPPRRFGSEERLAALQRRASMSREELPTLVVGERGAVLASEVTTLVGAPAPDALRIGDWCVAPALRERTTQALTEMLRDHHTRLPLEEGSPLEDARSAIKVSLRAARAPTDASLVDALLASTPGTIRTATTVRLDTHRVSLDERSDDLDLLLAAISGEQEAAPPSVRELLASGIPSDVLDAASRAGAVARIAPDLVVAPALVDRALAVIHAHADTGITVSALRSELGTSRRFVVPLVEWMDRQGLTVRRGDLRFPR